MLSRKDEFQALMRTQLDALHRRIEELERLSPPSHEHAISWDTVVGTCRRKHDETMRRLAELDDHDDASWLDTGRDVRDAVEELEREVLAHERAGA